MRRLKEPLRSDQVSRLESAVTSRQYGTYDDFLFVSYWVGLTPFAFLASGDQRYFCSEYVTDLLNTIFDHQIAHPLLKTPATYGSKYKSLLDVLQLTNMKPAIDEMYGEESVPIFATS